MASIGGIPVAELYQRFKEQFSSELDATKSEIPLLPDVLVDRDQALEKVNALVKTKAQVPLVLFSNGEFEN